MSLPSSGIHFPLFSSHLLLLLPKKNHYQLTDSCDRWPYFPLYTSGIHSESCAGRRAQKHIPHWPRAGRRHVSESAQAICFDCRSIAKKMKVFFITAIMCQVICLVTPLMTEAGPLGSYHL